MRIKLSGRWMHTHAYLSSVMGKNILVGQIFRLIYTESLHLSKRVYPSGSQPSVPHRPVGRLSPEHAKPVWYPSN